LAAGVVVADLNGDSLPDVVLANHGDELGENRGFHLNLEAYICWGGVTGYSPRACGKRQRHLRQLQATRTSA